MAWKLFLSADWIAMYWGRPVNPIAVRNAAYCARPSGASSDRW